MNPSVVQGISLVAFAYFLGSVPFGVLVAWAFDRNVNLRAVGSGNIGATNVARAVGRAGGILTLLLDCGKAVFVMALVSRLQEGSADPWLALAGGAVFLGHVFPVYLGFRGGKGVATALGVVGFLSPVTVFLLATVFLLVVYFTRYVSLGSLIAAGLLPLTMAFLATSRHFVTLSLGISVLVFYTHRENLRRLLAGQENRIGTPGNRKPAE